MPDTEDDHPYSEATPVYDYATEASRQNAGDFILHQIEQLCPGAGVFIAIGFHPDTTGEAETCLIVGHNLPPAKTLPMLKAIVDEMSRRFTVEKATAQAIKRAN